ncbi:MAG: phosphoribosyltransferase [Candidatus Peregrinibacteria bacterium Greene0416_19]|nr:MAG: phosphoribosyltransferase [Candidatus Peregrinibacteria bacterium Greene0416_19]
MLLDLLFPTRSLTGREGEWVTMEELSALHVEPVILRTHRLRSMGLHALDRVVAAGSYDDLPLLRPAIHTFKYRRIGLFAQPLGLLMSEASHRGWTDMPPVLCPVPLHWTRRFQRGFNQADLLARAIAGDRQCSVVPLLRRTRSTGHQAWRAREERFRAIEGSFTIRSSATVPSSVVLVDDLLTTGATMDACAAALKKAGATRVEGLVLALG